MGLIHLDAGVLIGLLDANDAHHERARQVLADAQQTGAVLALSASALVECLVAPARQGEPVIEAVQSAIARLAVSIVDLTPEIAAQAARLRARHRSLRLPDALVIATALVEDADQLATTDRRWPSQQTLGIAAEIIEV